MKTRLRTGICALGLLSISALSPLVLPAQDGEAVRTGGSQVAPDGAPVVQALRDEVGTRIKEFQEKLKPLQERISKLGKEAPTIEKIGSYQDYIDAATPLRDAGKAMLASEKDIKEKMRAVNFSYDKVRDHFGKAAGDLEKRRDIETRDEAYTAEENEAYSKRLDFLIGIYKDQQKHWAEMGKITSGVMTEEASDKMFRRLDRQVVILNVTIQVAYDLLQMPIGDASKWYETLQEYNECFENLMKSFHEMNKRMIKGATEQKPPVKDNIN